MATIVFNSKPLDREYRVTSKWGYRTHPVDGKWKLHTGIDLDVNDNDPANIYAVAPGTVIVSEYNSGYGYYTVLNHGGYTTLYAHMKGNNYKVGDRVSAGTALGVMGSTGNSTGNHLHLELRIGEATNRSQFYALSSTDPGPYLSGGSFAIRDNSTSTNQFAPNNFSEGYIDASGPAVGERTSMFSTKPLHPYIKIYIGDDLVLVSTDPPRPNMIQSFEYNRLQDAGEAASFTIFDDNWDEIEYMLAQNWDRVYIEYGYPDSPLKSKIHRHLLQNYSISVISTGVILSVSTVTEAAYNNLSPTTVILEDNVNKSNPTEFVKEVCRNLGLTVLEENFDSSSDIPTTFDILEDNPITYIQEVVVPQAAQVNEEIFYFYVDADNIAYFKRHSYVQESAMKTYVYQKGYDSVVIDLSFDIKGVFGGTSNFSVATGLQGNIIDPTNKTQSSYQGTTSSTITQSTGSSQHTKADQSIVKTNTAADNLIQTQNKLYYYIKNSTDAQYEATMTIIGDPTIELFENVRVINITDSGNLHHTSGVYRVIGINDSISGGQMISTLKLARNASASLDGIELINPKALVK